MQCRVFFLFVGAFCRCIQAYAPLQWMRIPSRELVVTPRDVVGCSKELVLPQTLSIRDLVDTMCPSKIPHFEAKSDRSIVWAGMNLCIEADRSEHSVRINTCSGEHSQKWNWISDGHGKSKIQLEHTNLCLTPDVFGEDDSTGIPLQLQECAKQLTESWTFGEPDAFEAHDTRQKLALSSEVRHVIFYLIVLIGAGALSLGSWNWWCRAKALRLALRRDGASFNMDGVGGVCLVEQLTAQERNIVIDDDTFVGSYMAKANPTDSGAPPWNQRLSVPARCDNICMSSTASTLLNDPQEIPAAEEASSIAPVSQEGSSVFVTTPIYYVNDVPHVGHAYTSVAADAVARFGRLDGKDTWFATGTDEHGEKVEKSAETKDMAPQAFCDKVSQNFQEMSEPFALSNDVFVRTTDDDHKKAVNAMWKRLMDAGLIYKGVYEGWYSIRDECFYNESDLITVDGEKRAPSGSVVEWRAKEPSYFFKLSSFEQTLLDYYDANPDFLQPSQRRNEMISFVKTGLTDLSVSRMSFSWGINVPGDDEHIIYVWIDALTNYLTVLGWPESETKEGSESLFHKFWPHAVHIVGKDIMRFHAVYWPAMLMGAGIPLPKTIFAHGWWTKDGEKISKSLGNVIDPFELVDTYGVDATRYFLLSAANFGSDANFSHTSMVATNNGFLSNALGNLLNRAVTLSFKNCDKRAPSRPELESLTAADQEFLDAARALPSKLRESYGSLKLHDVCGMLEAVVRMGNLYIDEMAPWLLRKSDPARFRTVVWIMLEVLRIVAVAYAPIMPGASKKMLLQLGVDDSTASAPLLSMISDAACVIDGNELPKPAPVFPRIEDDA